MSIYLMVKFKVKEGLVKSFTEIMLGARAEILRAPGCEGVQVLQCMDGVNTVVLAETWATKEIHDEYAAKMAESGAMDKMVPFLDGSPETQFYLIK